MHIARIGGRIARVGGRIMRAPPGPVIYDYEGGVYGAFRSFERVGSATAFTAPGRLVLFADGAPRITDRGLLLEGAATNLLATTNLNPASTAGWNSNNRIAVSVVDEDYAGAPFEGLASKAIALNRVDGPGPGVWATVSPALGADRRICLSGYFRAIGATAGDLNGGGSSWSQHPSAPVRPSQWTRVSAVGHTNLTLAGGLWQVGNIGPVGAQVRVILMQAELGDTPTSPIITTGAAATRGADQASLTVPPGRTTWRAVYGDDRSEAGGSGLVPGDAFDLVTGRPWIGLGRELKRVEFRA